MMEGGFVLRKWSSNCSEIMKLIDEHEQSYFQDGSVKKVTKVLGILWSMESDLLTFDLSDILRNALAEPKITKRMVLQTLSRIFDPTGFLGIAVFTLKILFQEICSMKIAWDEPLALDFSEKWVINLKLLIQIKPISIPRHYLCGGEMRNVKN